MHIDIVYPTHEFISFAYDCENCVLYDFKLTFDILRRNSYVLCMIVKIMYRTISNLRLMTNHNKKQQE